MGTESAEAIETDPSLIEPESGDQTGPDPAGGRDEGLGDDARSGNLRSTIRFPYSSLKDADQIASELHDKWGGSASPDQLSAGLSMSAASGAFRTKVATARTFGVVEVGNGKVSLTALGQKLVDHQEKESARVEAFLAVPLFSAVYEEYIGSVLPPDPGLEQKMAALGVSVKQVSRARQAFQRSAEQAGFFKQGRNRLVLPAVQHSNDASVRTQLPPKDERMTLPASATTLPPPLPDLWLTLLRDGRSWSVDKTQEFIETARKLHEVLAKD